MDYNHITSFLDKFKKLLFQKEEIKKIVTQTIREEINHQVDDNLIKIKDGYIFIQVSPVLRSEIMIHKQRILIKLKSLVPDINFLDIK
ncbi:MAG: hypothetical protein WC603_01400 [Candidatus Paceibacterota bacterium]|jgi:hypothetical protein